MKKILFIVLASGFLFSCSSSDSNSGSSINGTYKLTSFTTQEPIDANNDGTATTNFLTESGCYSNSKIILNSDNTALVNLQDLALELNVVAGTTNQYQYTSTCSAGDTFAGTWTKTGSTITITLQGEAEQLIITDNKLYLNSPDFVEYPTQNNGTMGYSTTGANLIFTKQ